MPPHLQAHPGQPQRDGDHRQGPGDGPVDPELAGQGRVWAERARIPLEERHGEEGGDEGAGQEEDGHRGEGFHRRRVVLGG